MKSLRLKILIVEDEPELGELLRQWLEALECGVEVATTGEAALQLLSKSSFDVALVDVELPDTTGIDVMRAAKASGWLGDTRLVFCTGSRSEEYRQKAAGFLGSSFLWKPFTLGELIRSIQTLRSGLA